MGEFKISGSLTQDEISGSLKTTPKSIVGSPAFGETGGVHTVNDTPPNAAGNVDVTFSNIKGYPEVRKATDYLNAQGEFKPISIGGASSASIYMSNEDSAIAGYKKLNYTPDTTETVKTITANNNTVSGEAYLMDDALNTTILDAGTWFFNYFRSVSSAAQESFKGLDVFVRHVDGTETLLFSLESASIEDTVLTERQVTYTQQAFSVALTDRLGVRSKFRTTRNSATVLSYVVGGARGWGMRTPLAIDHNNTRNKNANPDFQHITLEEKTQGALPTGVTNPSPISGKDLSTVKKLAQEFDKTKNLIVDYTVPADTSSLEFINTDYGVPFSDLDILSAYIIARGNLTSSGSTPLYLRVNLVNSGYNNSNFVGTDSFYTSIDAVFCSKMELCISGMGCAFFVNTFRSASLNPPVNAAHQNVSGINPSLNIKISRISILGGVKNFKAGTSIKIYRND